MHKARSVVALAVILAATLSYGPLAYADTQTDNKTATDTKVAVEENVKSESKVPVEVTVQRGDSLSQIAAANNTTVADIVANNNIGNPDLIEPGQVLKIQSDKQALADFSGSLKVAAAAFMAPPAPEPVVVVQNYSTSARTASSQSTYRGASSAGNTYVWGTCTWYVKQMKPGLPNQLGNGGFGWISRAAAYGYGSGSDAAPGAIGVQNGHVFIVDSINPNGTINISEMNYAGGVGVVHHRTEPPHLFKYIYA